MTSTLTPTPAAATFLDVPDGAVLAVGTVNWDYHLRIYGQSREVRAVPKVGEQYLGCQEATFGSPAYWRMQVGVRPHDYQVTPAGELFMRAPFLDLRAARAAW